MIKFISGLIKSPLDIRDYIVSSFFKTATFPISKDYTEKMTPIRNQGNEGSCVGFAMVAGVKEYQEQIDYSKFINLSPRFLYENAKVISGHKEGTTLKAAMAVVSKIGVCEEKYWPYTAQNAGKPSLEAYPNALKYKVATYARITNLTELKGAIVTFGPSLIGVKVYKGMVSEECKRTGIVPNPSCFQTVLGGHALCAVGYDDYSAYFKNDGHIKCKNSWGNFGDNGYIYLSYKNIKSNMLDAFSSVDIDDPAPFYIATVKSITDRKAWI